MVTCVIITGILRYMQLELLDQLRSLILPLTHITQAAARACYDWVGHGDEKMADYAAVQAMRGALNTMAINGKVVIGEGERDQAPMLYIGEEVGCGGIAVDIALDPLEGTTLCANADSGALTVIALSERGGLLHAPDVYMEKIAVGAGLPDGIVNLDDSIKNNLQNLARAKNVNVSDLMVTILNRPRHQELISQVRAAGARIKLISDGDVSAVVTTNSFIGAVSDLYIGIGGAPEGVLAACAQKCLGGQMQGRLIFADVKQQKRAQEMGIKDINKIYTHNEMVMGEVIFAATGVTDGDLLRGVSKARKCHSVVMTSFDAPMMYIA